MSGQLYWSCNERLKTSNVFFLSNISGTYGFTGINQKKNKGEKKTRKDAIFSQNKKT